MIKSDNKFYVSGTRKFYLQKYLTPPTSPAGLSEFHMIKNKDHKKILAEWSQLDEYKMVLWTHQMTF